MASRPIGGSPRLPRQVYDVTYAPEKLDAPSQEAAIRPITFRFDDGALAPISSKLWFAPKGLFFT